MRRKMMKIESIISPVYSNLIAGILGKFAKCTRIFSWKKELKRKCNHFSDSNSLRNQILAPPSILHYSLSAGIQHFSYLGERTIEVYPVFSIFPFQPANSTFFPTCVSNLQLSPTILQQPQPVFLRNLHTFHNLRSSDFFFPTSHTHRSRLFGVETNGILTIFAKISSKSNHFKMLFWKRGFTLLFLSYRLDVCSNILLPMYFYYQHF